jgi:thioester reductase-like protein
MNIDVLITGVTGFVGRFVLLEIIEKHPQTRIGVVIRPQKDKSPVQRFNDEIINDTMFSKYATLLSKVTVVGTSIEEIDKTSLLIQSTQCIIHCAANVKHYDPYAQLLQDNVHNISVILKLSETLNCKRLILLSTCYVHLKSGGVNGEVKRIPQSSRDAFYNDYCYTKWLGEEEVFKAKPSIEVNIVRLSCVGTPLRKDLQSHPFSAQAHLGILSLASRGYLTAIGLNSDARLSIIPVDLVSMYIVSIYKNKADTTVAEPVLHQICPPKHLDCYHPNLVTIFSIAQYELGITSLRTVINDGKSKNYLPVWYSALRLFSKKVDRYVDLHNKVQEFVLLFTSSDIRFDSSLPNEYFPAISEKDFLLDTYNFCIRTAQQLQFKKGMPVSLTDKFWHKMANNEPVQVCCRLAKPVALNASEELQSSLWALFCSNRKFATIIENDKWIYRPGRFDSHFSTIEFDESDTVNESIIISKGLNKYMIDNIWHCDLIIQNDAVTHILLQIDHGLTDGIGCIKPIANKMDHYLLDGPVQKFATPISSKNLCLFQEILFTLTLVGLTAFFLLFGDTYQGNRVNTPNISTNTVPIKKVPGRTFTTDLLWKLTRSLAVHTQHTNFLFCVPSVISVNRSADKIINNNFVPILLPVCSTMSEEQFKARCAILRSKFVIFIMHCIQELITRREWWWLRDKIMANVTAVVSSVNMGANMPSVFSSVHVATTTPNPILFCVTAISDTKNTFLTVRSQDSIIPASKILQDIC